MGFNLSDSQQGNKEGMTLQANQLEYIGIVLDCFFRSEEISKKAVEDIRFFEKKGLYPTVRPEDDDKWYTIQRVENPDGQGETQTILTTGIEDTGNHIVTDDEDMESGKTFIGVNPKDKVGRIANKCIKKYMHSGYEGEIEGYICKGSKITEYRFKDPKDTELTYSIHGHDKYFRYEQSGVMVRYLYSSKCKILTDMRCVNENGMHGSIVENNNSLRKKDKFETIKYSVEKKGNDLELNLVIPPDDEELVKYLEKIRKIESTK